MEVVGSFPKGAGSFQPRWRDVSFRRRLAGIHFSRGSEENYCEADTIATGICIGRRAVPAQISVPKKTNEATPKLGRIFDSIFSNTGAGRDNTNMAALAGKVSSRIFHGRIARHLRCACC